MNTSSEQNKDPSAADDPDLTQPNNSAPTSSKVEPAPAPRQGPPTPART